MKMHEIREIIKLFEDSSLQELEVELEDSDFQISLKKQEGAAAASYITKPVAVAAAMPTAPVSVIKPIPKQEEQPAPAQPKSVEVKPAKPINTADLSLSKIVSPMVGTFYMAPAEDADPFVKVGDKVQKATVVCIIEAMKLFNEIEAEVNGEIVEVLVKNGQLVEHGQPLFLVRPE